MLKKNKEGVKEDRGVMKGTMETEATTTLIKEERSSIKQQTARVYVDV